MKKNKNDLHPEIIQLIKKDQQHKKLFGNVRPQIALDFKDYKIVAVGNRVHYSKKWKTFHDFLFDYIKDCLGRNWGNKELKKDITEMHPILQWYKEVCVFQKRHFKKEGEINSAICTGSIGAYLMFAYDLYILRHHSKLQEKLLKRLKNKDQFQGARYELYVAASFIKAGFDIEFENEDDRSKTHCEFTATHKETKQKYSIEAKSRHRSGFLGQRGEQKNLQDVRLRIGKLLNEALKKEANYKRIIFIDANMPPEEERDFNISWTKSFINIVNQTEENQSKEGEEISSFIFLTNHPAHYIGNEEVEPAKNYFLTAINIPEFKENNPKKVQEKYPLILYLFDSLNLHNKVPHEFM